MTKVQFEFSYLFFFFFFVIGKFNNLTNKQITFDTIGAWVKFEIERNEYG